MIQKMTPRSHGSAAGTCLVEVFLENETEARKPWRFSGKETSEVGEVGNWPNGWFGDNQPTEVVFFERLFCLVSTGVRKGFGLIG